MSLQKRAYGNANHNENEYKSILDDLITRSSNPRLRHILDGHILKRQEIKLTRPFRNAVFIFYNTFKHQQ